MSCKGKFLSLSWQLPRVLGSTKVAARIFHDSFTLWFQWLFLVPIKGGRWHIIPQIGSIYPLYTTYILPSGVICYLPSFTGTWNNHWWLGISFPTLPFWPLGEPLNFTRLIHVPNVQLLLDVFVVNNYGQSHDRVEMSFGFMIHAWKVVQTKMMVQSRK